MCNLEVPSQYGNPYLKIRNQNYVQESLKKDLGYSTRNYVFYRFKEGKLYSGDIIDTILNQSHEIIFEGSAKEGKLEGNCFFTIKKTHF